MAATWNWKGKDGAKGGLLYESGNWGDLLKMLWVLAVLQWKAKFVNGVNYFDPFAGDVHYPLGKKTRYRIDRPEFGLFDMLKTGYTDNGLWPSAASGARVALGGQGIVEVWDADDGRRGNWERMPDVVVPQGESGWQLLRDHQADPNAVWMIDPYDFLAEWRDCLPLVAERSRSTTILLYIYNRSAKNDAAFREYRACKNALEDCRGDLPKRIGRAAADVFLPRCHHEMWFLPSEADAAAPGFASLLQQLADTAASLDDVIRRCGVCDA